MHKIDAVKGVAVKPLNPALARPVSAEATQLELFLSALDGADDNGILDICRRRVLHGTPFVFAHREDAYYAFRKRIASKFSISFHEVFITGSAKLGFSAHQRKEFDYDSDIDVAIVAPTLYERMMDEINAYQMALRESRKAVTEQELNMYHKFLEYTAIGWFRPDLLPLAFNIDLIKKEWFAFFDSLSYGRSEVGDYKVTAGIFRTYKHLEGYQHSCLVRLSQSLKIPVKR